MHTQSPCARFLCGEGKKIEKVAGHLNRAAVVLEGSVVAVPIAEHRLTVSSPIEGDFASVDMWVEDDDLKGQDAAIVRATA